VLRAAGFTAVNLETAITSGGTPQPRTCHFRAPPAAFTALRDAGIDLVTMASNHVLDYGQAGLAGTLAAARAARFPTAGIGTTAAAAWAPYLTTIKGTRIAVTGVSQAAGLASAWVATPARSGEAKRDRPEPHPGRGALRPAYGPGNFAWREHSYSTAAGILELTLPPHAPLTARFIPATVPGTGQPTPDHGTAARQAAARYASLRACAGLTSRPS